MESGYIAIEDQSWGSCEAKEGRKCVLFKYLTFNDMDVENFASVSEVQQWQVDAHSYCSKQKIEH